MQRIVTNMVDAKALGGTLLTITSAGSGWLDIAEPIVTMTVTIIVGGATLWYTVERALILRKARKEEKK